MAGTGYVGLSLAVLLSQHNDVTAVDIVPEKVEKLNNWQSPIQDDFIEQYLAEHEERQLSLKATTDGESAYKDADFIIVAAPTNYDPKTNFFDCSAVEAVLSLIKTVTDKKKNKPTIVIKSTIPVGYTAQVREKLGMDNIIFSPEFLRESKALYDNLYPSRIIVGSDEAKMKAAEEFAALLQHGAIKPNIDILFMATTEAEAVKLFANTYLALRVSYFNELDTYAEVNMNDYYDPALKEYRLSLIKEAAITSPVRHVFVKGSIGDKALIDKLFAEYHFDVVVNLAAQAGVRYSIDHPDVYIESNIIGFYNILEACRHNPVEHLVYASSSSVYGGNKKVPFSVDDKVDNPVSLYAATKKSNELLAHSYSKGEQLIHRGRIVFTFQSRDDRTIDACFFRQGKLRHLDCLSSAYNSLSKQF